MCKGAQVSFFNNILRFGIVAQDAVRHPVEPLIMTLHDQPKCGTIALLRAFNQRRIVEVLEPTRRLGGFGRLHLGTLRSRLIRLHVLHITAYKGLA